MPSFFLRRNPDCSVTKDVGTTPGCGYVIHKCSSTSNRCNHHVPFFLPYHDVPLATHCSTATRPKATVLAVVVVAGFVGEAMTVKLEEAVVVAGVVQSMHVVEEWSVDLLLAR